MIERIKSLREQNNHSQRELAQLLRIYQQQYAMYEQGKTKIPTEIIIKLCKLYDVSADYILGLIDEPRPLKIVQIHENGTEKARIVADCGLVQM